MIRRTLPTAALTAFQVARDALLRNMPKRLADAARDGAAPRGAFAEADKVLQLEYLRYAEDAGGHRAAYHNVLQVLALVLYPKRPPEYIEPAEDDAAYAAEVWRLARIVLRVLDGRGAASGPPVNDRCSFRTPWTIWS